MATKKLREAGAKVAGESVQLSAEEMNIVFVALDRYQKDGARVQNSADGVGIKEAATAASKWSARVDELKNKFLTDLAPAVVEE